MHCAATADALAVAKVLIHHGATIDIHNEVSNLADVKRCAWGLRIVDGIAMVDDCGASQAGSTPLHTAAWLGHADMVTLLASSGGNMMAVNKVR